MKKTIEILGVILIICLGVSLCYLIYKTWDVFGFWTLTWTSLLSIISTISLGNMVGSRAENNGIIVYNPKEWPKFINMFVSIAIGYYLFTIISNPSISNYDYTFGLAYLILLTAIPILIAVFKLIRDRNDFISLDGDKLTYKDNNETGEFKFIDIANVELSKGIKITFNDEKIITIKTGNMNFNAKDLLNVYNDIKAKLPGDKKEK